MVNLYATVLEILLGKILWKVSDFHTVKEKKYSVDIPRDLLNLIEIKVCT